MGAVNKIAGETAVRHLYLSGGVAVIASPYARPLKAHIIEAVGRVFCIIDDAAAGKRSTLQDKAFRVLFGKTLSVMDMLKVPEISYTEPIACLICCETEKFIAFFYHPRFPPYFSLREI